MVTPFGFGLGDHPVHGPGVAGVKPAGDIGGADDFQDAGIVADVVGAESLGHVGVQIDLDRHGSSLGGGAGKERQG